MAEVTGGHPEAIRTIRTLMDALVERGAWFTKDMCIEVNETGEMRVRADRASDKARNYMRIPVSLLPPLEFFDLSLGDDDKILCRPKKDDPTAILMQQMVKLYNETDKIGYWRRTWPFSAASRAKGLLECLVQARCNSPKLQSYQALLESGDEKELLLTSFLGSRQFNLNAKWFDKHAENRASEPRKVLLPMIDLLNHHFLAAPFDIKEASQPNMRAFMKPDPDTGELFIRYNQLDAVDTYLFYGFVDTHAPWLFSVPMALTLGDRTLQVMGLNTQFKGELPRALQDLRAHMPMVVKTKNDTIQITRLIVPHEQAPMALRRILQFLINNFSDTALNRGQIQNAVLDLEAQVLEKNQHYWDTLAQSYQTAKEQKQLPSQADEALQTLIAWAKERLQAYRMRLKLGEG